jgi:ribonuclease Z
MRPSFHPRLINPPFDDPGVYVPFVYEKRAFLFDLGDITALAPKDILKISHIFISHTHMDHFCGFDHLLRLLLGRGKQIHLYGPAGFMKNVEGKLAGYTWNLVETYEYPLRLHVTEVHPTHTLSRQYPCKNRFISDGETVQHKFNGVLLDEPGLTVTAGILDHAIPCLAFAIQENFHINIIKDQVTALGLSVGPWLKTFKLALFEGRPKDWPLTVPFAAGSKTFALQELADAIALITPGQKIAYVTDAAYHPANVNHITALAADADQLFIEAAFLEKDRTMADEKCHLTAHQAGVIAARAGAKQFTLFHFSPRYSGMDNLLTEEARTAFDEHERRSGK